MPINGLALIRIHSTLDNGQAVINGLHVVNESEGSPPDLGKLQGIADDFATLAVTPYKAMLVTSATMDQITVTQVPDPKVTPAEVVLGASHPVGGGGTRTAGIGTPGPREACALISLKTAAASRRFRGHNFVPPAQDSAPMFGEVWTGSVPYTTAINGWVTFLRTGAGPAGPTWTGSTLSSYQLACYSRIAELQSVQSVALVMTVTTDLRIRWLRSRMRGTS